MNEALEGKLSHYRIMSRLGAGGMGTVYAVEPNFDPLRDDLVRRIGVAGVPPR